LALAVAKCALTKVNGPRHRRPHACRHSIDARASPLSTHLQAMQEEGLVEAAFAHVLQAEQAAQAAIAAARGESLRSAEAARAETRLRAERTRRHVAAVRAAFERRLQSELARLAGEAEALQVDSPLRDADRARVEQAVAALAAELTAGEPDRGFAKDAVGARAGGAA
jgi:hypothetical protein